VDDSGVEELIARGDGVGTNGVGSPNHIECLTAPHDVIAQNLATVGGGGG
jgi:hypothetical protein